MIGLIQFYLLHSDSYVNASMTPAIRFDKDKDL